MYIDGNNPAENRGDNCNSKALHKQCGLQTVVEWLVSEWDIVPSLFWQAGQSNKDLSINKLIMPRSRKPASYGCPLYPCGTGSGVPKSTDAQVSYLILHIWECGIRGYREITIYIPIYINTHINKYIHSRVCVCVCVCIYIYHTHIFYSKCSFSGLPLKHLTA